MLHFNSFVSLSISISLENYLKTSYDSNITTFCDVAKEKCLKIQNLTTYYKRRKTENKGKEQVISLSSITQTFNRIFAQH